MFKRQIIKQEFCTCWTSVIVRSAATKQSFNRLWFAFANHFNPTQSVGLRFTRNDANREGLKKVKFLFFCAVICLSVSGCSLLQLPLELVKLPFAIAKKAIAFAGKMPKPPPGVIPGVF